MSIKNGRRALVIRTARLQDAPRIAELSGQLGYPATARDIAQRMRQLKRAAPNALLVAVLPNSAVIGWTHISVTHLVESGTRAELNSLIVAEGHRSLRVGARLLEAAEAWAKQHRCPSISVRSNVLRERAHAFYQRRGYEHYKTQKAFRKAV